MDAPLKVACIQAEPVVLDREATVAELEELAAEAAEAVLWEQRQRFDPAGHYHRPDVLGLRLTPLAEP